MVFVQWNPIPYWWPRTTVLELAIGVCDDPLPTPFCWGFFRPLCLLFQLRIAVPHPLPLSSPLPVISLHHRGPPCPSGADTAPCRLHLPPLSPIHQGHLSVGTPCPHQRWELGGRADSRDTMWATEHPVLPGDRINRTGDTCCHCCGDLCHDNSEIILPQRTMKGEKWYTKG